MWARVSAAAVWVVSGACGVAGGGVFAELTLEEAIAKSKAEGRLLIVDATAEWCGPCQMMERDTWPDERVVRWLTGAGLAIQVDVDRERETARRLGIESMPTLVAFREGKEFDRAVGYRSADQLMEWFGALERGESSRDAMMKAAGDRVGPDGKVDVSARMNLAREFSRGGDLERAREEYVWLWKHMLEHEFSMVGVRLSYMASEMQQLAERDEASRAAFTVLRDEAEGVLKGESATWEAMGDWIVLNEVVGDDARTLAWFDRVKGTEEGWSTIQRFGYKLKDTMKEAGRWADYAALEPDPVATMHQHKAMLDSVKRSDAPRPKGASQEMIAEVMRAQEELFREECGELYAAFLAAEREEEGGRILRAAREIDGSSAMVVALVRSAVEFGQAREEHLALLEEAGRAGETVEGLTRDVRRALESRR